MSVRSRIRQIQSMRRAIDSERRAIQGEERALLQRVGAVDLIEEENAKRFDPACPERSVTFSTSSPPRHTFTPRGPSSWGSFTPTSHDPSMDTTGRPDNIPTIERPF
jgi:hypothetical protein